MDLHQRLTALIDARYERSAAKLAERLNIHPNTFRGYLSEEGQEKIKFSVLAQILEITPGLSRDWLLFGEGQMFRGEMARSAEGQGSPAVSTPMADTIREAEIVLRRAGASEQSVWTAVHSLAHDRMGHTPEPDTEADNRKAGNNG
ncbi:hypothetical protein V6C53_05000 [Desulfocurvibacter africanus]|uniref:hypothetical protein n=1 Tax=Desulfocurvibacter africanus TaxID=873 RepID=UPI002FD99383